MTPTRWPTVLVLILVFGCGGWLLAWQPYRELISLPVLAAVTAAVIALFELALAWVVWRKVHRGEYANLHPLQVARAAVLAKASTMAGSGLLGFYGGFFLWVNAHTELRVAAALAQSSGLSALACLLLLVAALLLERACRTPDPPD